jgi:DNA-binding transcriptional MerR regulator
LEKTTWKIGELAEQTGITIRTLHHYHEKGLLIPSGTTEAGHRIYSKDDIIRLQQIMSLKQFDFSLDKIKSILEKKNFDPLEIIRTQLRVVEEQIKLQEKLKFQLETILTVLLNKEATAEDFIKLIGVFTMKTSELFTGDQIEEMISKSQAVPLKEKMEMVKGFKSFMEDLKYCYDNKLASENPKVKKITDYWVKLTGSFGDVTPFTKIREEKQAELDLNQFGEKTELFKYLQNAMAMN